MNASLHKKKKLPCIPHGGEIPFIRSGEIHGAKTELFFLTDDGLKYSSAKLVSKGDLIVALYGATSGEVDISQIDGAINQAILCIRPKLVNRTFLKYLLEDSKDDILNTYLQGGQGNLSAEIIKNLVFDIPDDRSQSAVVDFLDMIDISALSSCCVCSILLSIAAKWLLILCWTSRSGTLIISFSNSDLLRIGRVCIETLLRYSGKKFSKA